LYHHRNGVGFKKTEIGVTLHRLSHCHGSCGVSGRSFDVCCNMQVWLPRLRCYICTLAFNGLMIWGRIDSTLSIPIHRRNRGDGEAEEDANY
jgi:hypothetical protein